DSRCVICNACRNCGSIASPSMQAARKAARSRAEEKDRKSTRLNSSHVSISYAVFCLKKKSAGRSPAQANRKEHRVGYTVGSAYISTPIDVVVLVISSFSYAIILFLIFFNPPAHTLLSTLSLHDARSDLDSRCVICNACRNCGSIASPSMQAARKAARSRAEE